MNRIEFDFSSVDWGKDDAKDDEGLLHYFVTIPEYDGLKSGKYRYLIGRKGTGKTTICQHLIFEANQNSLYFHKYISLRNFPLGDLRKLEDKSMMEKSKYVPIWKFFLLCDLAEMVSSDHGIKDSETREEISSFLRINFPSDLTFAETITSLHGTEQMVNVNATWLGGSMKESASSQNTGAVRYQKATEIMTSKLQNLASDSTYFLIVDELDEGWRAGDSRLRLVLLALLRAVEEIATSFQSSALKVRPILALRSDIFDSLEDADLNKYHDYIVRLRWSAREGGGYALRRIVDARVAHSTSLPSSDNWDSIAYETDPDVGAQPSLWKWITNRTLERPRDVIKFLKLCTPFCPKGRLRFKHVVEAEREYSRWFYNELKDEIHSHVEVWRESLDAICKVGLVKHQDSAQLIEALCQDEKVQEWLESKKKKPIYLLQELFNFGIIGNIKANGYWQFKYKNEDALFDSSKPVVVHYGLIRKLSLKNNYLVNGS